MVDAKNPFVISAILCAIVLYTGLVKIKTPDVFSTFANHNDIILLRGKIISNPVKNLRNGTYSCMFCPNSAETKTGAVFSCLGTLGVSIDEEIVEANFPGTLYSRSIGKGNFLCEDGARAELSGTFSEKGIFYVKKAKSLGFEKSVFGMLSKLRALSRLHFRRLMYAWGNAGGFLLALISGSREAVEPLVTTSFRNAGIAHILALSGMHLSLISTIAIFAGFFLFGARAAKIFQFFVVLLFVWFAGFSPSLLRASLCLFFLSSFDALHIKNYSLFLVLCLSFLLHIVIAPMHIMNVAFMLSYGALAGIVLFAEKLKTVFIRAFPDVLAASLASSCGAQTFAAPISLGIFGSWMPIGIIASMLISPLVAFFMYGGLLFIMLCLLFPFLSNVSGIFMNAVYELIKTSAVFFSKFPGIVL